VTVSSAVENRRCVWKSARRGHISRAVNAGRQGKVFKLKNCVCPKFIPNRSNAHAIIPKSVRMYNANANANHL